MTGKKKGTKRLNTYFRQTARAFRAARQTQIYSHINRNLAFRIYRYSKDKFVTQTQKLRSNFKSPGSILRKRWSNDRRRVRKNNK